MGQQTVFVTKIIHAPYRLTQGIVGDKMAPVLHQLLQQCALGGGQGDRRALGRQDLGIGQRDPAAADLQDGGCGIAGQFSPVSAL